MWLVSFYSASVVIIISFISLLLQHHQPDWIGKHSTTIIDHFSARDSIGKPKQLLLDVDVSTGGSSCLPLVQHYKGTSIVLNYHSRRIFT